MTLFLLLCLGDDDEMDVDRLQMASPGPSAAVVDATDGHAGSLDGPSRNVHDSVQSKRYSFNLQQMDAILHEVVMRRLRSPVGYESLARTSHLYKLSTALFRTMSRLSRLLDRLECLFRSPILPRRGRIALDHNKAGA